VSEDVPLAQPSSFSHKKSGGYKSHAADYYYHILLTVTKLRWSLLLLLILVRYWRLITHANLRAGSNFFETTVEA